MTDDELLGWLILLAGFIAGYILGHQRGQIAGIRWATKHLDDPIIEK